MLYKIILVVYVYYASYVSFVVVTFKLVIIRNVGQCPT